MSYAVHSGLDLALALVAQFPTTGEPALMNGAYCAASRGWVAGKFAKWFHEYLAARGDLKWRLRGNQCEHFALRAALEAVHLFSQTDDPQIPAEAESLAVAACKYRIDGKGWHEVNLWWLDGTWEPWEPQTMAFFQFSASERATVHQVILP